MGVDFNDNGEGNDESVEGGKPTARLDVGSLETNKKMYIQGVEWSDIFVSHPGIQAALLRLKQSSDISIVLSQLSFHLGRLWDLAIEIDELVEQGRLNLPATVEEGKILITTSSTKGKLRIPLEYPNNSLHLSQPNGEEIEYPGNTYNALT